MNLVGDDSVFFVASHGISDCDASRDFSFCAHTINEAGIMVVEDAALDPRFHDNPLVKGGLIRFYAGIALRAPSGHALGALCVIDGKPHSEFAQSDHERLLQLAALASDRLELRRMEVAARASAELFEQRAIASPSAVITCDERGLILSCNTVAETLFGQTANDLCGCPIQSRVSVQDRVDLEAFMRGASDGTISPTQPKALPVRKGDGTWSSVELYCSHWYEGEEGRLGMVLQDMQNHRRTQHPVNGFPHLDPATGLHTLEQLLEALEHTLATKPAAGLIVAGLVGFSDIANTLGHVVSDKVLCEVGKRLRQFAPSARILARIGGDEFGLLLDLRDPIMLARHARDINVVLAAPLWIDGQEIRLGSCCGIAIAPDHALVADDLLGNAELALLQARTGGRGAVALYVPHLRAQAVARRLAEAELHRAFAEGQFDLVYQPQVRLSDQSLIGAEALLRWEHPSRGRLLPAEFLPLLEASSLAGDVGNWVLDRACAQLALWRRTLPHMVIGVNVFEGQFHRGDLPGIVTSALARHGLPADAIDLEITENIVLDGQDGILRQMEELRTRGVRMSFDDFGTGFASLNLLRNYPISHIKIDKSFVQLAGPSPKDRAIIASMIRMGHELGLTVTAEGIESAASAHWLLEQKCDHGQGYHFGRPCTPGEFAGSFLAPAGSAVQHARSAGMMPNRLRGASRSFPAQHVRT